MTGRAAIHSCSLVLAHAPDLVRHGSKPTRELAADSDGLLSSLTRSLRSYEDAVVWRNWSEWLEAGGWRATAQPGRGARVHINYPLSQTLLRDGDRAWLARRFWEDVSHGSLSRTHDQEMLLAS